MGDRAQASVEFMLVLGLGMVILLPATILFYNYSQDQSRELELQQVIRLGNQIVNEAERVYYYSDPSKLEIQGIVPSNVFNITVESDWSVPNRVNILTIWVRSGGRDRAYTFLSRVNIQGTFEARDFTPGQKRISLEVKRIGDDPYVDINFI
ncbi:MAG: hypothetical protein AABX51_00345 [Nanoarchaeota archaeon]